MPDIYCDSCHKKFWWIDDSRHYCRNCIEKFKIQGLKWVW